MSYNKIRLQPKVFDTDCLLQTYVQPKQIMYRTFFNIDTLLAKDSSLEEKLKEPISEDDLWSNADLLYRTFEYNGINYVCTYNILEECCEHIVEPYREVYTCVCIPENTFSDQQQIFFADRLGDTYFSKGKNMHWTAFIKTLGCQYLYRFLIEPGKDLTTAAVFCPIEYQLLTNLEFDFTHEFYDEGDAKILQPWMDAHKPVVTIEGPDTIAPNATATYTLKVFNADGTENTDDYVYLIDCKQGYAPSKEVFVTKGVGTFKITALGLEEGESLRFKINDQVWTSYAEKRTSVKS